MNHLEVDYLSTFMPDLKSIINAKKGITLKV
ncbi:MAG: hypothetical protein ACI884_001779 [Ulvibacter sp.]|jgi:hypothetical protein